MKTISLASIKRMLPWNILTINRLSVLIGLLSLSIILVILVMWQSDDQYLIASMSALPFAVILVIAFCAQLDVHRSVKSEVRALEEFSTNADDLVAAIKADTGWQVSSPDIEALVSEAVLKPTSHSKELIESVAKANLYILNAPVESMLHTPRQDLETRLKQFVDWGYLSTRLGILGTFFGLVFALSNMSGIFAAIPGSGAEDGDNTFATAIQTTLSKLSFAFITSLWGLLGGVIISLRGGRLRRDLADFYAAYGSAFSYGRELAHRIALRDQAVHASLAMIGDNLKSVERRLVEQTDKVSRDLLSTGMQVGRQAEFLENSSQKLNETRGEWTQALDEIGKASGALEVNAQSFVKTLNDGVTGIEKEFSAALPPLLQSIKEHSNNLKEAAKNADETARSMTEATSEKIQNLATKLDSFLISTSESYDKFADNLSQREHAYMQAITRQDTDRTAAFDEQLSKLLTTTREIKDDMETAQQALAKGLNWKLESLTEAVTNQAKEQDNWINDIRDMETQREESLRSFLTDFKTTAEEISRPEVTINIRKNHVQLALLTLIGMTVVLIFEIDTLGDPLELKNLFYFMVSEI